MAPNPSCHDSLTTAPFTATVLTDASTFILMGKTSAHPVSASSPDQAADRASLLSSSGMLAMVSDALEGGLHPNGYLFVDERSRIDPTTAQ